MVVGGRKGQLSLFPFCRGQEARGEKRPCKEGMNRRKVMLSRRRGLRKGGVAADASLLDGVTVKKPKVGPRGPIE